MLDFGFSEILLTSAIALVVLGPERLPKVARQVGNWMGRARAMARQLSDQLEREVNADEFLKAQTKAQIASVNRIGPAGPAAVPVDGLPADGAPAGNPASVAAAPPMAAAVSTAESASVAASPAPAPPVPSAEPHSPQGVDPSKPANG